MVQGKKAFNNSKPKFAEVVIGDSEAKEMRVAANGRPSRSPYLKLVYPNGVTLILPADWRKRSIPTHSEWLYPLTFDAGKGLKEA